MNPARHLAAVLPTLVLVATGIYGIDYGYHWDEDRFQIAPVRRMIETETLLPGIYIYPSMDYWIGLSALAPEVVSKRMHPEIGAKGRTTTDYSGSHPFKLRLRSLFLLITALSPIYLYIACRAAGRRSVEAFLAASYLGLSWEVAYHARFIAPDGILMQFGAMTLMFCTLAWGRSGTGWLRLAAVVAGLGCGTKYPGALLFLPVAVAWWRASRENPRGRREFLVLASLFLASYLVSTPGMLLQPTKFLTGTRMIQIAYSSGLFGFTVEPGIVHFSKIINYLCSYFFSHFLPVSLAISGLALAGVWALAREDRWAATMIITFPVAYILLFSSQRVMFVRNLLVLGPFLAVLAARGTVWVGDGIRPAWAKPGFIALIGSGLILNALWLAYSSWTIRQRGTGHYLGETVSYISKNHGTRFFLSEKVKRELIGAGMSLPPNVASDPRRADEIVLYMSEGFRSIDDWPCNEPGLIKRWFGPYEINIAYYTEWAGDDRIAVMRHTVADAIGIWPIQSRASRP